MPGVGGGDGSKPGALTGIWLMAKWTPWFLSPIDSDNEARGSGTEGAGREGRRRGGGRRRFMFTFVFPLPTWIII